MHKRKERIIDEYLATYTDQCVINAEYQSYKKVLGDPVVWCFPVGTQERNPKPAGAQVVGCYNYHLLHCTTGELNERDWAWGMQYTDYPSSKPVEELVGTGGP